MEKQPQKLLDQVRKAIRRRHYSIRTEQSYVSWIKRYVLFHNKTHPRDMGKPAIEAFLTHLAVGQNVTASAQNQALSGFLLLYRQVLKQDLEGPIDAARSKPPERLPTIMTKEEVGKVIGHLSRANRLMAGLLYGSGLRLMECMRLRVKGMDFC